MAEPKLYDYNSSFALMRTNPALSGNVKITLDSSGRVWLNSFDADELLSSDVFKKYSVSGKKTYAEDLFNFFNPSLISSSVVFKVNRNTNGDIAYVKNFSEQYDFFYGSGAQTLIDRNYEEDFSYFAPLWIKSEIPDFFAIFKVPGPLSYKYSENQTSINTGVIYKVVKKYGQDNFVVSYGTDQSGNPAQYSDGQTFTGSGQSTYNIISGEGSVCIFNENLNLNNVGNPESYFTDKILPNAEVLKTFDLRAGTLIGDYIRSVFNTIGESFSPITINFGNSGFSYFNGISINSGVYTSAGEFMYEFLKSPDSTSQIDLERYVTEGFSRNGIICPNLLNLEFLFSDDEADNYEINRYFGAYVSRNDLGEFLINGDFYWQFKNSEGNENYPKPNRDGFGYYSNNSSYPVAATSGVRLYYQGASGFIPGSNDTNDVSSLKLFYITDKNENFYSLKRIEDWTSSVTGSSAYGYGPYNPSAETFGTTGSTGATSGTLVIQNNKTDLLNFSGIEKKLLSAKGEVKNENGRPYIDIKFNKSWDLSNDLVFKVYWPLGSRQEGSERYDLIKSGDFSGTIIWVPGSTYSSGNNYFFNASNGSANEISSAFSESVYSLSEVVWDSGRVDSTSIIRVKSPNEIGNSTYYISVFDDYDYFESKYQWNWSSTDAYAIGDIVKYGSSYYQAISSISFSSTASNANPELSEGTQWEKYYSFSNSGYVSIKDTDAADISGVSYFQGGTDKPRTRVIFSSDLTNIVKPGNWIQTTTGFSLIKEISKFVDEPVYDQTTKLVSSFNDFYLFRSAVISDEYQVISLGSDSRFNVFGNPVLKSGVFTFFDFKDFDFDFWSSTYGTTPNYETYRYFNLLPGVDNQILSGITYYVRQGSVTYNGSIYVYGQSFDGVSGVTSFSQNTNNPTAVVPLQFTNLEYSTSGYPTTNGAPALDIYQEDLDDFTGFWGIVSVETQNPPAENATKKTVFDYRLLSSEYDYLQENYTTERSNISRIVPYITKWAYKNGSDSRGNRYRLNATPAFSPSNFSPTFENLVPDPKYLTHEWFMLEDVPRQFPVEFMRDQKSYIGSRINLTSAFSADSSDASYLLSYLTVSPSDYESSVRDDKDETREFFSELTYNEASGFYETVFKGSKVILKKRTDSRLAQDDPNIDTFVSGYRGYEGYKYTCILRAIPEDSTTIQSPVSYRFIENKTQKFIVFLVDVVMNDYKLQELGYTGGTGGDPVVDYTLLYSLSDKNKLLVNPVVGTQLYGIDNIKLSSALDLSISSNSLVDEATPIGRIYTIPNPDYASDMREEISSTYPASTVYTSIGSTGERSFNVPAINCQYPWPVGAGQDFVEFTTVASNNNYYFEIPFSPFSPSVVPIGSKVLYENNPVFQIRGGKDYFDFILKRTSYSYVLDRVNNSDPYVKYTSYYYDNALQITDSKANDFSIQFDLPSLIIKNGASYPQKVYSSVALTSNANGATKGPSTESPQVATSYNIVYSPSGTNSDLLRYSGKYEPIFRKIIFYKNDKSDTIPGTGVDLTYRNCTFSPNTYNFGLIKNLSYSKKSNVNILAISDNLSTGPVYPLLGQTPIDRRDFNVFQSSWDSGYYRKYTGPSNYVDVAGTRSMLEFKTFLGSKIMKTPANVIIDNYIVLQLSPNSGILDSAIVNTEAFNALVPIQSVSSTNSGTGIGVLSPYSTPESVINFNKDVFPNVEIFWQRGTNSSISGTILLDRMLRRYLMNDGVGEVFFQNVISEFGIGDPALLQDDILGYIDQNVIPIYEGNILQLYVKKTAALEESSVYQVRGDIASSERLRLGYYPEKNVNYTKVNNLTYNFEFNIDPQFTYSLIFRFNIDKI